MSSGLILLVTVGALILFLVLGAVRYGKKGEALKVSKATTKELMRIRKAAADAEVDSGITDAELDERLRVAGLLKDSN